MKPHVPDARGSISPSVTLRMLRLALSATRSTSTATFTAYTPPRPLDEIESDIRKVETDVVRMLAEVTESDRR